jgi:hypothetical protein
MSKKDKHYDYLLEMYVNLRITEKELINEIKALKHELRESKEKLDRLDRVKVFEVTPEEDKFNFKHTPPPHVDNKINRINEEHFRDLIKDDWG